MTDTERLADVIALVVHAETEPLLTKVAVLEARPVVAPEFITAITDVLSSLYPRIGALEARSALPGPVGDSGVKGLDGTNGRDGKDGTSATVADVAPLIAAEVTKAVATIPTPKDGRSLTVDDVAPLIVGEVQKHIAAIPPARDGVGFTGAMLTREGHLTLTRSDGTTQDVGAVVGPPGQKGADGLAVEPTPGLSPDVISASVDMLLRKEFAALDAAAPPRMTKRIIRDARGRIERVIEEPARGER